MSSAGATCAEDATIVEGAATSTESSGARDAVTEEEALNYNFAYWKKDSLNRYYVYLNDLSMAPRAKAFWMDDDLILFDTLYNCTIILEDYYDQPSDTRIDARIFSLQHEYVWFRESAEGGVWKECSRMQRMLW